MTTRFQPAGILSTYQAIEDINNNFSLIADLMDKVVMRDGEGPNSLLADLDANQFRLLNVGNAVNPADAPNLAQVQTLIGTITKGDKGDPGPAGLFFATRTALKAYTTHSDYDRVSVTEYGYEGDFIFLTAATFATKTGLTLTTVVTDDSAGGFVIPPAADLTGASGAWVRQGIVRPIHFGCASTGAIDDTTNFNKFWSLIIKYTSIRHDATGSYGTTAGGILIGPSSVPATIPTEPIVGRIKIVALGAMNELVHVKNLQYRKWRGSLWTQGTGSTSFASRTCLVGVYFENCARLQFTEGTRFQNLAVAGAYLGTANDNLMDLGFVEGLDIASGHANGYGLTGNWSLPVNSGSSGSTAQTATITVDTLYSTALDAYLDVTGQNDPVHIRLGGYLYSVRSIDRVGSILTVYPWIDTTTVGTSGTFEWVFGGIVTTKSTDASIIRINGFDATRCGRGFTVGVGYGPFMSGIQANTCGTVFLIGRNNSAACSGTTVTGYYLENCIEHVVFNSTLGTNAWAMFLGDSGGFDLSKCWALGDPRATGGAIVGGEFGTGGIGNNGVVSITRKGRLLSPFKNNLARGPGSTYSLIGHSKPPAPEVYLRDSHTLNLKVVGTGENNRLFGFSGSLIGYVGTGTNGAPTGSFTFAPPTGGTINGGAVDATAVFTGFAGPVMFSYEHTDAAQLTWIVRPMSGWRLKASATFNPPSIAAAGTTTTTVACTGAALGDAFLPSFSLSLAGLMLTADVSAADTVRVVFYNPTAGAVDLASGTLTVTKVS